MPAVTGEPTISFAAEDAPSEAQQAEVMDAFEKLAFAGLDGEQYDMLWVRHSHEDRIELHFCTPRLELTTGRSLNIAPPGYQDAFDSLRDLMNQHHGWADPMELERAQEVRDTIEAPTRAHVRTVRQSSKNTCAITRCQVRTNANLQTHLPQFGPGIQHARSDAY